MNSAVSPRLHQYLSVDLDGLDDGLFRREAHIYPRGLWASSCYFAHYQPQPQPRVRLWNMMSPRRRSLCWRPAANILVPPPAFTPSATPGVYQSNARDGVLRQAGPRREKWWRECVVIALTNLSLFCVQGPCASLFGSLEPRLRRKRCHLPPAWRKGAWCFTSSPLPRARTSCPLVTSRFLGNPRPSKAPCMHAPCGVYYEPRCAGISISQVVAWIDADAVTRAPPRSLFLWRLVATCSYRGEPVNI